MTFDLAQGHGFDWTTIGLSIVGLALDIVPPAKGADVLVTVIKNTNRLCGKEVANRLVKVAWEMASDKAKRNALLKMSGFMATEVDLLPKLLKNADDMTEFGNFFAKYGDEGGNFLKKMGKIVPSKVWKEGNLDSHYQDHVIKQKEFDELFGKTPSPEEYEKLSKDVIEKGKKVIYKHQGNFDRIGFFYEKEIVKKKVVFVGVNDKGETITCFVPDEGWNYVKDEFAFQWAFKVDDF